MRGQTNPAILKPKLQRRLRKALTNEGQKLWQRLRGSQLDGCKFRRQHPYFNFILDFVCLKRKLVVEVDGGQHSDSTTDAQRDAFLLQGGFCVLRFWNSEVMTNTDDVVAMIWRNLEDRKQHHPRPGLSGSRAQPSGVRSGANLWLANALPHLLEREGEK